jgi:hypothetical protein
MGGSEAGRHAKELAAAGLEYLAVARLPTQGNSTPH